MIFSVVIPVYNDFDRLKLTLDSLNCQTFDYSLFEIIIVDNNSSSPILDFNSLYPDLDLRVIKESKIGSYAARNTGIRNAKYDIIALTDSDCIPDKNWLRNAYRYFRIDKDNKIGILTGKVPLFYRDQFKLSFAETYEKYTGFDFLAYSKDNSCGAGNWFSYKSIFYSISFFDDTLKSNGDTKLSKIISNSVPLYYSEYITVFHPSRYFVHEIVYKYRRLIGGTYQRRFKGDLTGFIRFMLIFSYKRVTFSIKKLFTINFVDSFKILIVSFLIFFGSWSEFFNILIGKDTKR
ncbi:glycosyltransferase family A protein [Cyclobacterium sp. 1_MG-2023]|uniref:glycosyltransferase family 2 protein n=1 Tax=Cyclobacterium sp. 1_MG-2023 TaxID=3062681 RepID=UPI0026E47138|nr:glycosyltransferase family A protein [Cyclobacterium sp. 1_MG-2023]MDO6439163.1 glycosyltransferase family A protein [Cyclobacterium sp. 1_MG-2023]